MGSESEARGFRPTSRRRSRIAAGVALGAVAVAGNVLVYSSLDDRQAVLQVVRDIPAGTQISAADLRPVAVAVDASVRTVPADLLDATAGRYARVRLVAGSLLVHEALQDEPLVARDAAVVAVQVPSGQVPTGTRERSRVELVLPRDDNVDDTEPVVVTGRLVGLPTEPESVTGLVSLSVEVAIADVPSVAGAESVGIALLGPGTDPAEVGGVAQGAEGAEVPS
jgi:SAF domain